MITFTSANNIRTDNPIAIAHFARKIIEVVGVARQSVNAEQSFLMFEFFNVAPLKIIESVKTMKTKA
jgi:hypothetical protein